MRANGRSLCELASVCEESFPYILSISCHRLYTKKKKSCSESAV